MCFTFFLCFSFSLLILDNHNLVSLDIFNVSSVLFVLVLTGGTTLKRVDVKLESPKLQFVYPTCFEAGKPIELVVCGLNLLQPKCRYGCQPLFWAMLGAFLLLYSSVFFLIWWSWYCNNIQNVAFGLLSVDLVSLTCDHEDVLDRKE